MKLYCINHTFHYELENLIRLFFPFEKTEVFSEFSETDKDYLYTSVEKTDCLQRLQATLKIGEKKQTREKELCLEIEDNISERALAVLCFDMLQNVCGFTPKWGILTGVRPSKLMMRHIESDGEERAKQFFRQELLVSPEKANLAATVAVAEKKIISLSEKNDFSLYISIPFCPTRCSYCSFVSHSISTSSARKLMEPYVEKLCGEIKQIATTVKENSLRLRSVYWGGGTPTTLEAEQLDRVLTVIEQNFDFTDCLEYTVEAGRPDTVTDKKLEVLKKHGVSRISINPQTFNDDVLKQIGRHHSVQDTVDKYLMARSLGFDNINMDLIAGLPTDTLESFCRSIDEAIALSPENITVHTLALKRSATLVTENQSDSLNRNVTADMTDYAYRALTQAGYMPYYMYRQSRSLGNLENVGWCKENKACYYNIFMMEECQSIMSAGAGAVTKLVADGGRYIERIFNYKYPFEYIERFDGLMERKERISSFFAEYK